ncbi:MAG: ACT domain-containing protein [Phycisphaerae bacterium]|nr:ACT domain-containing protein [Phycisphaerae bacterium]
MRKAVQLSVALDNTAGSLAALCGTLHRARVNIDAISVSDNTDCGWVRLLASPPQRARAALVRAKYTVSAQQVVALDAPNRPGELARICKKLARAGINVNYVYGSTPGADAPTLVLGVSDAAHALDALAKR